MKVHPRLITRIEIVPVPQNGLLGVWGLEVVVEAVPVKIGLILSNLLLRRPTILSRRPPPLILAQPPLHRLHIIQVPAITFLREAPLAAVGRLLREWHVVLVVVEWLICLFLLRILRIKPVVFSRSMHKLL